MMPRTKKRRAVHSRTPSPPAPSLLLSPPSSIPLQPIASPLHTDSTIDEQPNGPQLRSSFFEKRYLDYLSRRSIIGCQFIDLKALTYPPGLECLDWVTGRQLVGFITRTNHFYPEIVREFYSNLYIEFIGLRPSRLISRVFDLDIYLSIDTLHAIFHAHPYGIIYLDSDVTWSQLEATKMLVLHNVSDKVSLQSLQALIGLLNT